MVAEVEMITLDECAVAYPDLRFTVAAAGSAGVAAESRAEEPHDLAGIGKLLFGLTLAQLGEAEAGFFERAITVTADHRAAARTGTLRLMSGDLELSVDDALNLVFSTGDGACVLALRDVVDAEGVDLFAQARAVTAVLGLDSVQLTGIEADASWGEGLLGQTTTAATVQLLRLLGTPGDLASGAGSDSPWAGGVSCAMLRRVSGWMGKVFEPAGLASALPGYGPRRVPHQTLSGWELTAAGAERGYSSVLSLPNEAGEWVHVAAHLPPSSAGVVSPRDVSAVLGTLGLAAYHSASR